ncbi:hypothetical protein SAMN04489761_1792 [Tenacibaculum sp. MAR_2009_124]|uniref:hypothetical protein n=1 Tax=Tenacibaculum sp. MAR_2009_124 TaxID=1250059 RepID=UPI0008976C6F|nr:hypothetical protein [Tenacibaculum sp. MAR_2009_124]SEB79535.1 hypothetical protein SAMN04489761_1792 [Tenacibaculum sp. MAR_2009_124]
MRNLMIVMLLFSSFYIKGQDNDNVILNNEALKMGIYAINTQYGSSTWVNNPSRSIEGSVFLFENWSNTGVFHTRDKKELTLKSININLSANIFVARFGKGLDSLFTFDSNKIGKVRIGKSSFKFVNIDGQNRIAEELLNVEDYALYKYTFLGIIEGSVNPMLSRKSDKYVKKSQLYFQNEEILTEIKLKKKSILKVVAQSEEERKSIERFYKKNKLSFKKIESLKKYLTTL